MLKIVLKNDNNIDVAKIIQEKIAKQFSDEGKSFFKVFQEESKQICVFICEDYSFSTNSRLTISIISEASVDKTIVNILVSGGKIGLIFETSYGSEKRRAKQITNEFKEFGFVEIENDN